MAMMELSDQDKNLLHGLASDLDNAGNPGSAVVSVSDRGKGVVRVSLDIPEEGFSTSKDLVDARITERTTIQDVARKVGVYEGWPRVFAVEVKN